MTQQIALMIVAILAIVLLLKLITAPDPPGLQASHQSGQRLRAFILIQSVFRPDRLCAGPQPDHRRHPRRSACRAALLLVVRLILLL